MSYEFSVMQSWPDPESRPSSDPFHHCRIAGLANNMPFCVDLFLEHDGRDVETKPIWGVDVREDFDFFEHVFADEAIVKLHNADYKRWEATQ